MASYKGIIKYTTGEGPVEAIIEEYPLLEEATSAVLVSLPGPYNLVEASELSALAVGDDEISEALDLATAAESASAVTTAEVIDAINEALTGNPARLFNGRIIIEASAVDDAITIAGEACILIFGETSIDISGTSRVYSPVPTGHAFIKTGLTSPTIGQTIYYDYSDCNSITIGSE